MSGDTTFGGGVGARVYGTSQNDGAMDIYAQYKLAGSAWFDNSDDSQTRQALYAEGSVLLGDGVGGGVGARYSLQFPVGGGNAVWPIWLGPTAAVSYDTLPDPGGRLNGVNFRAGVAASALSPLTILAPNQLQIMTVTATLGKQLAVDPVSFNLSVGVEL